MQLGLFSGMVFEENQTEERSLTEEQAATLLTHLADKGLIHGNKPATKPIELPKELETAKNKAVEIIAREGGVTPSDLAGLTVQKTVVVQKTISPDDAQALLTHFEEKGYITKSGKIKDSLKSAVRSGSFELPPQLEGARTQIAAVIRHADTKPPLRDASRDVTVRLKKEVAASPEFLTLWDQIKQKTVYRVQIDESELVRRSVAGLKAMPPIPKTRIVTQTADIHIEAAGVTHIERGLRTTEVSESYSHLPNILVIIGEQTLTKRATVYEILKQSERLQDFLNDPQMFIEYAVQIIRDVRRALAVDGISYKKLYGEEYFWQEIFDSKELIANLERNAVAVDNSIYDYIIYDSSTVEKPFAMALDSDPDVKMFLKLPDRFKVDTPIGTYNPDWAVYMDIDGIKKLYFVIETKGSTNLFELSKKEKMKIQCGKTHFQAIDTEAQLHGPVVDWKEFRIQNAI